MKQILISVIIPVYRVEKYIRKCLDSIIMQTYRDLEIIIINDGSPDKCPQICDEYAAKDTRIKVIHQENSGVSVARNRGINEATGKYIYFVDSDDWLFQDALELLCKSAEKYDADLVLAGCFKQYEDGSSCEIRLFSEKFVTKEPNFILQLQKTSLWNTFSPFFSKGANSALPAPWSKLIKRDVIVKNNLRFDPYVQGIYDDGLFSLSLWEHSKKIVYEGDIVYNYRIINTSLVHAYRPDMISRFEKSCEKVEEFANKYEKDISFWEAEYCRRIAYLSSFMTSYFFADGEFYKNSKRKILDTITREPWAKAIESVKYKDLELKHRYTLICMRFKVIWGLKLYSLLKRKLRK